MGLGVLKGGGWLVMVEVCYTTLNGGISEGECLTTLSTPPGSAPALYIIITTGSSSLNVMIMVSAILV